MFATLVAWRLLLGFTGQLARFWPGLSFVDDSA
jgi:hypothetical protein